MWKLNFQHSLQWNLSKAPNFIKSNVLQILTCRECSISLMSSIRVISISSPSNKCFYLAAIFCNKLHRKSFTVKHLLFVFLCYFVITGSAKLWRRGLNKFNEAQSGPFCWYCCQQRDLIQHNAGPDYPRPNITVQKVSFNNKGPNCKRNCAKI